MIVFDTETEKFTKDQVVPPPFVAMGWCSQDGVVYITQDLERARATVFTALLNGELVVGHNMVFDLRVLGVFVPPGARVWDTMIADLLQRLASCDARDHQSGQARFRSLSELAGGLAGKGEDSVQTSFKCGHPITAVQREYLIGDVEATRRVAQRQIAARVPGGVPEQLLHVRAALALKLLTERGLPIDQGELAILRRRYMAKKAELAVVLRKAEVYAAEFVGPKGGTHKAHRRTDAMREHVRQLAEAAGVKPTLTDTDEISLDKAALRPFLGDPVVVAWRDFGDVEKLLSAFIGGWEGRSVINPNYNVLMRSGRTSCYGPNLQQVPSRGWKAETKRVFVAPSGRWLWELDYCQLELCCLAYLTQGNMLRAINSGRDLHRELGAVYFKIPAEEVTKEQRQLMKAANFGLPGGMGAQKFRLWLLSNGQPDPGDKGAEALIDAWHRTWPEMEQWLEDSCRTRFDRVWSGRLTEEDVGEDRWDEAWLVAEHRMAGITMPPRVAAMILEHRGHPDVARWLIGRSVTVDRGRIRYPVSYTESKNTRFQGLAANLTKDALARAVLDHGVAVHLFVHDSLLISTAEAEWPEDVARVMLAAAHEWLPGVRAGVEISGPGESWYECKKGETKKIE